MSSVKNKTDSTEIKVHETEKVLGYDITHIKEEVTRVKEECSDNKGEFSVMKGEFSGKISAVEGELYQMKENLKIQIQENVTQKIKILEK